MAFGTVIKCMDGRIQGLVQEYLKKNFEADHFDSITDAGPIRILSERTDTCRLNAIKEQLKVSLENHGSRLIAVAGHHDCAGNPVDRETQEKQVAEVLDYLRRAYGKEIRYVGLYVNENWEVEELE